MKRTWIVYTLPGCGHEYSDSLSEATIYGPFTKEAAHAIEAELNRIYAQTGDDEDLKVHAMPLDTTPRRHIVLGAKMYVAQGAAGEDEE